MMERRIELMEPMKPETKRALLETRPEAQPADLEEYQRLLSLRYAHDPSAAPAGAPAAGSRFAVRESESSAREARLAELHQKLFGTEK
jgi:hypothetical protein